MFKRKSAAEKAALLKKRIREEIRSENIGTTAFIGMHRINLGTINSDPYLKEQSSSLKGWMVILAIVVIIGAVFGPAFAEMFA